MKKLTAHVNHNSYEVWVGQGILTQWMSWIKKKKVKPIFIIADRRLKAQVIPFQKMLLKSGCTAHLELLDVSEALKDFQEVYRLYGRLFQVGMDRSSLLVAFGGGVIGDLTGFVAGTYMRGIAWVGIPTTLLGQVDSSMGGKAGVNHPQGKNLIGVFHQPSLVISDTDFLRTLPKREIISGMGEILKYGLALDAPFLNELKRNWTQLMNLNETALTSAIYRCAKIKTEIVEQDPFEQEGVRAFLNFGHTLGHALEAATQYSYFKHGEAVIWGMRAAIRLSEYQGHLNRQAASEAEEFLAQIRVPKVPVSLTFEQIKPYLKRDKKAKNGNIRFVLLSKIGQSLLDSHVSDTKIQQAFEECRQSLAPQKTKRVRKKSRSNFPQRKPNEKKAVDPVSLPI